MPSVLFIAAVVIILCALLDIVSKRAGLPLLLIFILLGVVFGEDGLFGISFDDFQATEKLCEIALIFIMFYGGFGTNWKQARPVAGKSILLSTAGVVLTAGLTGLFCHLVLHLPWAEAFLTGSVVSSTDAASVFSILRSRRLNLKDHTASLLEVESGSNDPAAYMLTMIFVILAEGDITPAVIGGMVAAQIGFGMLCGVLAGIMAGYIAEKVQFEDAGFDIVFIVGMAVLAYSVSAAAGGNGYLAVYLCGILLGNREIRGKKKLVHFFDGFTNLMQILLFFMLGLVAVPHSMPEVLAPALMIAVFLLLVARPAAIFLLLAPLKCAPRQMLLISFAGLRGAASIVFAIMALTRSQLIGEIIFDVVFIIVLLSILVQGTFLPAVARKLEMIDDSDDVMKTFTDYSDEKPVSFIRFTIPQGHPWSGMRIAEITLPPQTLVVLIDREGTLKVPDGNTAVQEGDRIVLSARATGEIEGIQLSEVQLSGDSEYAGRPLSAYPVGNGALVILIGRGRETIIPKGSTVLQSGDLLVLNRVY